jgi:hypothetical protein
MKRTLATVSMGLLILAMASDTAWAQATAQMSGTVRDQSGAVLPGTEVTATQTETGASRATITNETGYYVLANLPLGPYKLEAALPGFRTFVQTGIVLQVNSNPTFNVVLQVGNVSEQIEVQANAALVETRSLSVGQVVETSQIMELPLNGRNAQELMLLGGGAVQAGPAGGGSFPGTGRLLISTAGALGTSMETTLDGIRHVDTYDGYPMLLPFPDALAEFKTEIGGTSAQQWKQAQASAVTKSGTNQFNGDLFEFVRNDLFNARNYFATKGSSLKRNQFGGTIGGPIIKNRLFFFAGYQGTTLRQDPSDIRQFVPTAAMLAGDFTAFTAPACNAGRQLALKAPFANNRVDPALFSPVALKVAARLPKTNNQCGEVTFGKKTVSDEKEVVSKMDYQVSNRHSLFGRFLFASFYQPSPFKFTPDIILNTGTTTNARSYAFTAGSTYLISSTTVNAFRLSFTRTVRKDVFDQYFDLTELGSKVYSGYLPKFSTISVSSGFTLAGGPPQPATQLYQLADDVSITRGTHQFGFGGRVAHARVVYRGAGFIPSFTFNGDAAGNGLADFLLGKPSALVQTAGHQIFTRMNYFSLYGQDTWQWKPRVAISAGLRWSPVLPQVDTQRPVPYVMNWDIDRYRQGLRSTVFVKAPPGLLFPGDPGFQQKWNGNPDKPMGNLWNAFWNDFSPRIGLAWDVRGDGHTSVRASYGLSYEDYPANTRLGTQSSMSPYGGLTRILAPEGGLDDPWRTFPGGNPHPLERSKSMLFPAGGDYMPEKADLTPTYTQSWNLSLQREVTAGTLVSANYIGTRIIHTQATMPLNLAIYVPGVGDSSGNCLLNGNTTPFKVNPGSACSTAANTQDRRQLSFLNPAFKDEIGRLGIRDNGGTQNYHGMLLSLTHRPTHGTNVNANYTWSHCIGDYTGRSNTGYGSSVDQSFLDPNNRRHDRGNCEIDQRHNFNLTGLAETPKFANRTLSLIGSGWRLSGIYRRTTAGNLSASNRASGITTVTLGDPGAAQISSGSSVDRCLCDLNNQRPNLVLPDAIYVDKSARPGTQWLNPAAFALPALGTLGNMGRATLRLPTAWQFDVALARVFRLREAQSVEFRAEAYNVLNSFRPGEINTTLTSTQFGKIRTALDPRILQFALKYVF